ncbi:hypothetical protein ACVI1I_002697 [Bradyrhizobium sp. USDA 4459]
MAYVVDQQMAGIGLVGHDVLKQSKEPGPILDEQSALAVVFVSADKREIMGVRVCRDHGGLIFNGVPAACRSTCGHIEPREH